MKRSTLPVTTNINIVRRGEGEVEEEAVVLEVKKEEDETD